VQLNDVLARYRHCSFCGRGVRSDHAFVDDAGGLFHSAECHDYSLRYHEIRRRLGDRTNPASGFGPDTSN